MSLAQKVHEVMDNAMGTPLSTLEIVNLIINDKITPGQYQHIVRRVGKILSDGLRFGIWHIANNAAVNGFQRGKIAEMKHIKYMLRC